MISQILLERYVCSQESFINVDSCVGYIFGHSFYFGIMPSLLSENQLLYRCWLCYVEARCHFKVFNDVKL